MIAGADPSWLLAALVLAPLGALGLIPLVSGPRALLLAVPAALPALGAALLLPTGTRLELPWLLLGTRLELDPTGATFLLFTALLWLIAGLHAAGAHANDAAARRFAICFLLAMSGNLGLIVAADVASFYTAFTLMSFAAYGLVIHRGDPEARRAARVYLVLVVVGEVALFLGMAVVATGAGTLLLPGPLGVDPGPLALALLTVGFGLKAGVVPLHVWLPLAHPAAPVAASAVLSGAMIKAGLLGLVRFLPLGSMALPALGEILMLAGLGSAFYGVLIGLTQSNPKTVLAYSSISQIGLMVLALGIGVAIPEAAPAALLALPVIALHHGLAKGALFLACGVPKPSSGAGRVVFAIALLLPALALAGAPLTSGLVAKTMLDQLASAAPSPLAPWLPALLPAAAVGTGLLMARFLVVVWTGARPAPAGPLVPTAWAGAVVASGGLIWILPGIGPGPLAALGPAALAGAMLPLLIAVALVVLTLAWRVRLASGVPAGDVLTFIGAPATLLRGMSRALVAGGAALTVGLASTLRPIVTLGERLGERSDRTEDELGAFPVAGACLLVILLVGLVVGAIEVANGPAVTAAH